MGVAKTAIGISLVRSGTLQITYTAINTNNSYKTASQVFVYVMPPK
jgi:hypothetical protein